MKWEGNRESDNVEDRRGSGGGGGMPVFGGRSIGIGTIVIALLGGWVLGINPLTSLGLLSGGGMPAQGQQGGEHGAVVVVAELHAHRGQGALAGLPNQRLGQRVPGSVQVGVFAAAG